MNSLRFSLRWDQGEGQRSWLATKHVDSYAILALLIATLESLWVESITTRVVT